MMRDLILTAADRVESAIGTFEELAARLDRAAMPADTRLATASEAREVAASLALAEQALRMTAAILAGDGAEVDR